ncbi:hypothetical protein [Streptomyces sp. NPDC048606]|uniref:hypothetical protein n=1 Tax=Streptomyces sp. NPDC048606 TaxID=3154726 RepID=UPI003445A771
MHSPLGLAAATAAAVLLALPAPAPAAGAPAAAPAACVSGGARDSRGNSSVDGSEIMWEDETRFDDAIGHAHRVWSSGTLTRVRLRADTTTAIADLQWRDVDRTDGSWANRLAQWAPHTGADNIYLNRGLLDAGRRYGAPEHRRRAAAHELGHALGFCHKSERDGRSLLWADYRALEAAGSTAPTERDIRNYHLLWG